MSGTVKENDVIKATPSGENVLGANALTTAAVDSAYGAQAVFLRDHAATRLATAEPQSFDLSDNIYAAALVKTTEQLTVTGGNRTGSATVMLPDNYDASKKYPMIVAIHNYNGNASEFSGLIDAEKLRKAGNIVLLPDAADKAWQGQSISYFRVPKGENGQPVDDVAFVKAGIEATQTKYADDPNRVVLAAFSQGVSVAYEVARQMDLKTPGAIHSLVVSAGSMPRTGDLAGTNVVQYEPGYNGMQHLGNTLKWDPAVSQFLPKMLEAKHCELKTAESEREGLSAWMWGSGLQTKTFKCAEGTKVKYIYEPMGEHAWPGQPQRYDSLIFGRGSRSQIKLTDLVAAESGTAH